MRLRRVLGVGAALAAMVPVPARAVGVNGPASGRAGRPQPAVLEPVRLAEPRVIDADDITDGATGIGPGSLLAINLGPYTVGCTANFVWNDGPAFFLGTAGHCVVPGNLDATAGAGALFNPAGVRSYACVAACLTANRQFVELGAIAYGRRRDGVAEQGRDFGLITIPASLAHLIRPSMPVWSGPVSETGLLAGPACMYGNGAFFNRSAVTRVRTGALVSTGPATFTAAIGAASGDSGSGIVMCAPGPNGVQGTVALGIVTHVLGAPFTSPSVGAVTIGTTIPQAQALASEAGLNIHVVTTS